MKNTNSFPFFVVGSERSGSTMLRLMLEGHADLSVTPEFEFATAPLKEFAPFPKEEAFKELSKNWIFRSLNIPLPKTNSWAKAMQMILSIYGEKRQSKIQGAVVHKDFEQLPRIFPKAKYIHLIRDPRDVAYSVVKMGWASNVISGVQRWMDAESSWEWLHQDLYPSEHLEVRFEDLVREPTLTLNKICDFLGISFDKKMLEYHQSSTYGKPDQKISQAWRQRLSEKELGELEHHLGRKLCEKSYLPSGVKMVKPSALSLWLLPLKDWLARFKHRRSLYGTSLLIEEFFARKTGFSEALLNRLHNRMEAIWLSSLK